MFILFQNRCSDKKKNFNPISDCEGTFLVFRIMTLGWMTRWLVLHRDQVPFSAYTMGSIGNLDIVLKKRIGY